MSKRISNSMVANVFLMAALSQGCATVDDLEIGIFGYPEEKMIRKPESYSLWRAYQEDVKSESKHLMMQGAFLDKVAHLINEPLEEQAEGVNEIVNKVKYERDTRTYKKDGKLITEDTDNWKTPGRFMFLDKAGDCEEYALTKYFLLKKLGVEEDRLRIVLGTYFTNKLAGVSLGAHAVLAVYTDEGPILLDNKRQNVIPIKSDNNFVPFFSINAFSVWGHSGRPSEVSIHVTSAPSL